MRGMCEECRRAVCICFPESADSPQSLYPSNTGYQKPSDRHRSRAKSRVINGRVFGTAGDRLVHNRGGDLDFAGADFSNLAAAQYTFLDLNFRGANFQGAFLEGTQFRRCSLGSASFRGAFVVCSFEASDLTNVDFSGSEGSLDLAKSEGWESANFLGFVGHIYLKHRRVGKTRYACPFPLKESNLRAALGI